MRRVSAVLGVLLVCGTATACFTREDCSDHGNCVNGACQCDPGYNPPTCSGGNQHLCQSRADCNNHGNCVNGVCECDAGWAGATCTTETCPGLRCQHGSTPAADCSSCTCVGCWTGVNCTSYPSPPPATCSSAVSDIASSGKQFARHVGTNLPLPPIPGWRSLGFGADAPGNTLGGFPVFLLNFSTPNKIWTAPNGSKYLEPDYFDVTDVDPTGTGQPVISCTHHSSVASLYSSSGSTLHGGLGLPLSSPTALQSAYFQNANTATVCVGQLPLYQAQLPSDTPLSRFGLMMANALPPSYSPSSSGVFSSMFRSIGTNAVRSVTMGGVAVVVLRHGGCLTSSMVENMSKSDVQTWASRAMSNIFNGDTWSTGLDPTFVGATEVASQTLTGGNPETKLPAWKATVVSNPVPITWTMDNLYSVFPAPGSSVLQQAVDANAAAAHTAQAAAVKNATAAALANWLGKQQMYIKMSMKTQSMYENKTWTTVTPTTLAAGEHSVAASVDASTNPLTVYVPDGSNNDDYRLGTCIRLGGTSITLTKFAAAMCKRHSDGTAEAVTASLPDGKQSERTYEALFVPAVSGHKYGCTGDKTKYEKGKDVDIDVSGSSLSASASAALPACVITDTASYTVSGHHTDVRAQLSIRSKCCIGVEPNDKDGSLKCRPL